MFLFIVSLENVSIACFHVKNITFSKYFDLISAFKSIAVYIFALDFPILREMRKRRENNDEIFQFSATTKKLHFCRNNEQL